MSQHWTSLSTQGEVENDPQDSATTCWCYFLFKANTHPLLDLLQISSYGLQGSRVAEAGLGPKSSNSHPVLFPVWAA